jgi:CRISPR-associated protein Csm2
MERREQSGGANEIEELIKSIGKLHSLKELKVEDFAPQGGYAEKIAQAFMKQLKTAQLRKFFDSLRKIERDLEKKPWDNLKAEFLMLEPRLAASVARKLVPDQFYRLMKVCFDKVNNAGGEAEKKESFTRLMQFLEAIVAYHKYHEEKSTQGESRERR